MKNGNKINTPHMIDKSERILLKEDFLNLFSVDVQKVFSDYFSCSGMPKIEVCKNSGGYIVSVSFYANGLKFFNSIPK